MKKQTAVDLELEAAGEDPPGVLVTPSLQGEAMSMLVRRALRPKVTAPDVPFPTELAHETAESLAQRLAHYAFRLFLRGAILKSGGFAPSEATRYLAPEQAKMHAEFLVDLGLAERTQPGRYRMIWPAKSFGGTLEWYIARELEARFGFDVLTGVNLQVRGGGGDVDVVAAAEGKLVCLELKSSPPKNLSASEVAAFFHRLRFLRPDLGLFVVDTALRLSDKVVPMLRDELGRVRSRRVPIPTKIADELWALTPYLYIVNGRRDLMANIARAIAEGLRALAPRL